jgi:hypothetical protein
MEESQHASRAAREFRNAARTIAAEVVRVTSLTVAPASTAVWLRGDKHRD